jgi:hypothetical protein
MSCRILSYRSDIFSPAWPIQNLMTLCLANCYEGQFLPLMALRECDEFHFRNTSVAGNRSDRGSALRFGTNERFLGVPPRSTEYRSISVPRGSDTDLAVTGYIVDAL